MAVDGVDLVTSTPIPPRQVVMPVNGPITAVMDSMSPFLVEEDTPGPDIHMIDTTTGENCNNTAAEQIEASVHGASTDSSRKEPKARALPLESASKKKEKSSKRRRTTGRPSTDDEFKASYRASSPTSSHDGLERRLRRNAPRGSTIGGNRNVDGTIPSSITIPEFNMLPPSSPTASAADDPSLIPYASPRSMFRPPPSAALEIFTKPPSPSFRLAFRGQIIGELPASASTSSTLTPLPNSISGASIHHPIGSTSTTNEIDPAVGDQRPFALAVPPENDSQAGSSRGAERAITPQMNMQTNLRASRRSLVGNDTSPYAIKIAPKTTGKRKGKAKASDPDGILEAVPNHDYCSACGGIGRFLCCDGCPRSFHFMCLEPPLNIDELPQEDEWFCKQCDLRKHPKSVPSYDGIFGKLLKNVERSNPREFRLPDVIRNAFTNVQTQFDGAYLENHEQKPVKFDRAGFPEEGDIYRLKSKGQSVICFRCKGSAAPVGAGVAAGIAKGRRMLSCDYCALHWHLDCLDPPPPTMPHPLRKWMCPNHAQALLPKKRTLKHGMTEEVVTQPGTRNNGIVEIFDPEAEKKRLEYEAAFINGKRYKVPERIIHLDFWNKIGRSAMALDSPTLAAQHSKESIFGGQSPLSTAPSSPTSAAHPLSPARESSDSQFRIDPAVILALLDMPRGSPLMTASTAYDTNHTRRLIVQEMDQETLPKEDQEVIRDSLEDIQQYPYQEMDQEVDQGVEGKKDQIMDQGMHLPTETLEEEPRESSALPDSILTSSEQVVGIVQQNTLVAPLDAEGEPLIKTAIESGPLQESTYTLLPAETFIQSTPHTYNDQKESDEDYPRDELPVVLPDPTHGIPLDPLLQETEVDPSIAHQTNEYELPSFETLMQNQPGDFTFPETRQTSSFGSIANFTQAFPEVASYNQGSEKPNTPRNRDRLRPIAAKPPTKLPGLILQPSENGGRSVEAPMEPMAELPPSTRKKTPPIPAILPEKLTAPEPLQAYSNPQMRRPRPTAMVQGSTPRKILPSTAMPQTTPTKITLKLPGQNEVIARLASARANGKNISTKL